MKKYVKPAVIVKKLSPPTGTEDRTAVRDPQPMGNREAGSRFAERRSVPRYPYAGDAQIIEALTQIQVSAKISEISARGCYVERLDELPKNTVIRIFIHRESETFESWARVAYVHPGTGTGIAFLDTTPAHQQMIDGWIADISAFLGRNGLQGARFKRCLNAG